MTSVQFDQTLCRLCLRSAGSTAVAIFADGVAIERLRSRILDCCPVELFESELLPRVICGTCEARVNAAYEFREQCRRSQRTLRYRYDFLYRPIPLDDDNGDDDGKGSEEKIEVKPVASVKSRSEEVEEVKEVEEVDAVVAGDVVEAVAARSNSRLIAKVCRGSRRGSRKAIEETPAYLCDVCSKTFASKSGLRFHLKGHNGSKPHVCRYCDKGFAIPSYRKRHERVHAADKQRYVCHVCSASFASSNGFKYHMSSHTGEANHRCDTCGKSFRRYKYLKEHVFTHTGERPFACKICGAAYGNSGSLFAHERKCKLRS